MQAESRSRLLRSSFDSYRCTTAFLIALLGVAVAGCGRSPVPQPDVDEARALIVTTMNAWASGETPAAQRGKTPPIYVADEVWLAGTRLKEFEVVGDAQTIGGTVRFHLAVVLSDDRGAVQKRDQVYVVTTHPARTVARVD